MSVANRKGKKKEKTGKNRKRETNERERERVRDAQRSAFLNENYSRVASELGARAGGLEKDNAERIDPGPVTLTRRLSR